MTFITEKYRDAPSGIGPLASEWDDKPHRLVYDLCREVERLQRLNGLAPRLIAASKDLLAQMGGTPKSCGHATNCVCPADTMLSVLAKIEADPISLDGCGSSPRNDQDEPGTDEWFEAEFGWSVAIATNSEMHMEKNILKIAVDDGISIEKPLAHVRTRGQIRQLVALLRCSEE